MISLLMCMFHSSLLNSSPILFILSPDSKIVRIIKIGLKLRNLQSLFIFYALIYYIWLQRSSAPEFQFKFSDFKILFHFLLLDNRSVFPHNLLLLLIFF